MSRALKVAALALAGACLGTLPAHAGLLDSIFGGSGKSADTAKASPGKRTWTLGDFSSIQLVAREAGTPDNEQPVQVDSDFLQQQLSRIRLVAGRGTVPLFSRDEVADLAEPLAEALATAGPGDDILLLSSARRSDAVLLRPVAVTARLFVQSGRLQFVVHDARFEFFNDYVGSRRQPVFTYGSRTQKGVSVIRAEGVDSPRPDWLSLPLTAAAAAATAPKAAPAAGPAVAPAVAPAAPAASVLPVPAPAPATTAPAAKPARDDAFYADQERRLKTLKRLRDENLISEEEYQRKRKEVLDGL